MPTFLLLSAATALQEARDRFYRGPIRRLIRKFGLNKILSDSYWRLVYRLSQDIQSYQISGMNIHFRTDTFVEFMRFRDLGHEQIVLSDLINTVQEDDVFYDIGANVGTYTCFTESKIGNGDTVAFEPEPKNARKLSSNLELNELHAEIIKIALSDSQGQVELTLSGNTAGEGKHSITDQSDRESITVDTSTGDSVIEQRDLEPPTVLKIDVEGAEVSVLRGLERTLKSQKCRLVYCEVHPEKIRRSGESENAVQKILQSHGFKTKTIVSRTNQYFLKAEKNSKS